MPGSRPRFLELRSLVCTAEVGGPLEVMTGFHKHLTSDSAWTKLTSIGRKIACDRSFPGCKTCQRRQKVCPGYFENLSWPREGDKRRSATANVKSKTLSGAIVFLNTSSWDASLHHEYQQSGSHGTLSLISEDITRTNPKQQTIWEFGLHHPQAVQYPHDNLAQEFPLNNTRLLSG